MPTTRALSTANIVTAKATTDAANTASLALKADIMGEAVTDYTITSAVLTFNLTNGNVGYLPTAASANYTINVTNPSTTDGRSTTITLFAVQGATGYIPSAVQVSGVAQTIKWPGGTAPTPTSTAAKIDVFSFTLVRRSAAWTVLGTSLLNF